MSGFVNSSSDTINPGGFLNTTTSLEVTSSTLPVDVTITNSLPAGTNFLGYFALQGGIPQGSAEIGTVTVKDGATVVLQNGTTVGLSGSLPAGTNNIGIVSLADGTLVALAPGQTVGIDGPVTVSGTVSLDYLPDVTITSLPAVELAPGQSVEVSGTVGVNALPDVTVSSIPAITIAPGQSIAVTGVDLTEVVLDAGTNHIGQVSIDAALPAGDNNIGNVDIASALPAGTNSLGSVGINAGSNLIGKVETQGVDPEGVKRSLATDGEGALVPPTVEVNQTIVTLLANTSTEILAPNPQRLLWMVQLVNLDNVLIAEAGQTLASLDSPGTMIYSGGSAGTVYTPAFVHTLGVNALCGQTTTIRVTEYSKV